MYDKCEFLYQWFVGYVPVVKQARLSWYRTFLIRWWGSCWWAAATKVLRVAKEGGAGVSPSTGCGSMCGGGRGRGMPHGNNHGPGCCITPHYHTTLTSRLRTSIRPRATSHSWWTRHGSRPTGLTESTGALTGAHYLAADAATTWPISCSLDNQLCASLTLQQSFTCKQYLSHNIILILENYNTFYTVCPIC